MSRAGHLSILAVMLSCLAMPVTLHSQGRTPSAPVGASMALLATLQDADILPPEGTPAANRVVQIVIQLQSLFMKSTDPSVQAFVDHAFDGRSAARTQELGVQLRSGGWTSEIVEALCDDYRTLSAEARVPLAG